MSVTGKTILQYSELTTKADNDKLWLLDVSDTTMSSGGTNKQITIANLLKVAGGTDGNILSIGSSENIEDSGTALSDVLTLNNTKTVINKTIDDDDNILQNIATSALKTRSGQDGSVITGTKGTSGDLSIWNADGDLVDGPTPPSGAIVGTTDTQTLTNKTLTTPEITLGLLNDSLFNSAEFADDSAKSFDMPAAGGLVLVWQLGNTADGCLVVYRQTSAACNILFNGTSSNWQATTGVLNGTTGADTKYTISAHTDGKIYVENRRGSTQYLSVIAIGNN